MPTVSTFQVLQYLQNAGPVGDNVIRLYVLGFAYRFPHEIDDQSAQYGITEPAAAETICDLACSLAAQRFASVGEVNQCILWRSLLRGCRLSPCSVTANSVLQLRN